MKLNDWIQRTASKPIHRGIGLMSGTALDGLDIALCQLEGYAYEQKVTLLEFTSIAYPSQWRRRLEALCFQATLDALELTLVHTEFGFYMGEQVKQALERWGVPRASVDFIASHGQTLYHAPRSWHRQERPHATLQIGDGDALASASGMLTVSDFRTAFTAIGHEGAPLVPFVEELLFRSPTASRVLLNIGGIANITYLPPRQAGGHWQATDTGPGNTLINRLVQTYWPDRLFDEGGAIAASESPHQAWLEALLQDPWFNLPLPRSTGPEYFNLEWMQSCLPMGVALPSPEVQIATATALTAHTIAKAIRSYLQDPQVGGIGMPAKGAYSTRESNTEFSASREPISSALTSREPLSVYLSGGGVHNATLLRGMEGVLPEVRWCRLEELGWAADAKEALAFAVLAHESLFGDGVEVAGKRVYPGKISRPSAG